MNCKNMVLIITAVIGLSFASISTTAAAEKIKWDAILGINVSKLDAEQKKRITNNLVTLRNTRGCSGTLANCVSQGDLTARRHAGFVARMVRRGKSDKFIAEGIVVRHKSAFPKETFRIDLTGHPNSNPRFPKVNLVEYACFQCPFCAHIAPQLKQLPANLKGKVAHFYKFFPVRSHKRGVQSALAGLAAHRQGKFWQMHDLMYANRTNLEDADLTEYATRAKLDMSAYATAIKDRSLMKFIEKDKLEGMRIGVEGTPTFIVNGKVYLGLNDYDEIIDRLDEELDIVEGRIH